MSIIQRELKINGIDYVYSKSDEGRYICRDNFQLVDSYDKKSFGRTYTEGDLIVEEPTSEELLNILLGGDSE